MSAPCLYLEGSCGIAGDMLVGALLDLGGSEAKLRAALASMPFDGYALEIARQTRDGIPGTSFTVHLHAHEPHHGPPHAHRHLADVLALVDAGDFSARAKDAARTAFRIVAEAEAKAHGTALEEVHFHEVGAVDSICDVVSACVLMDDLGWPGVVVEGFAEGSGTISCAHGELAVPVPAVRNVSEACAVPLWPGRAPTEIVTPTGIALAAALRTASALPDGPRTRFGATGVGFGTRAIGRTNCLRVAWCGLDPDRREEGCEQVALLEANVDDADGEQLGAALNRLFAAGALDCQYLPCSTKKNRPAWLVRVIAHPVRVPALERILFADVGTLGVRRQLVWRDVAGRESVAAEMDGVAVEGKRSTWAGASVLKPEADSVRAFAAATGFSFPFAQHCLRLALGVCP